MCTVPSSQVHGDTVEWRAEQEDFASGQTRPGLGIGALTIRLSEAWFVKGFLSWRFLCYLLRTVRGIAVDHRKRFSNIG